MFKHTHWKTSILGKSMLKNRSFFVTSPHKRDAFILVAAAENLSLTSNFGQSVNGFFPIYRHTITICDLLKTVVLSGLHKYAASCTHCLVWECFEDKNGAGVELHRREHEQWAPASSRALSQQSTLILEKLLL